MSIQTNLHGRLRNTNLPKTHGLLPVFETVVNSIHAIEERGHPACKCHVILRIKRSSQNNMFEVDSHIPEIEGFEILDNGAGFNDGNLKSLETLDSDHKIAKGCRGVGRLLWLKAFEKVFIESSFCISKNESKKRSICFDANNGVKLLSESVAKDVVWSTSVTLSGFDSIYCAKTPQTADSIAKALLEHCLWYFVRPEGAPKIFVEDENEIINLHHLYEKYMHESAFGEQISIKEQIFDLTHIKFRASSSKKHGISLCAASRLVKEESIVGKIPGLHGGITDDNGEFIYSCYISSPYLDERVRSERTDFDISESIDDLFSSTEISMKEIREKVLDRSAKYLNSYLENNLKAGRERINEFISKKAPRYGPILSRIEESELAIDPNISDKDLEMLLHKKLTEVERTMLEQGHEIFSDFDKDTNDYQEKLSEYLRTAEDIKKSDLASYVTHRRTILDLLEKSIQRTESGNYAKESLIHELIMPMRKDSSEVFTDSCNLWLLDERLAFHNYLASDKTLSSMPITGSDSTKEPDLCVLNVCDNPILVSEALTPPLAAITVIEIKRPMRNDAQSGEEKDPIEQTLGYLNRIREGKVSTKNGRPIANSEHIPGYCYIVCDLTESIINRCRVFDLTTTNDHLGFFGFHKGYNAYIEVISYDKMVNNAKERNRAFFDKLGLPAT